MPESNVYSTLYYAAPTTSNATLYTSSSGDGVKGCFAINTTGSAATISLTLVRKGGSPTDGYATVIANAYSVPANSTADLLASLNLTSEYSELLMESGDYLYGEQGTSSAITLLVRGS
jgi:hypothetical protein